MNNTVVHYATQTGKDPFEAWRDRLKDRVAKASITRRVLRIELGDFGDYRRVGDGVSELRIDVGPGYRVYFGTVGSTVVVLLLGGDKGSQARDIARAKAYWNDFQAWYEH